MITEEKIAAHLNGLHISSEFTRHNSMNDTNNTFDVDIDNFNDNTQLYSTYRCSVEDIEEKLKRAQRITVADVVREISEEPLLPASIMERYEKPSKALVIWQPPQRISDLIVSKSQQKQQSDDDETLDNNNIEFNDLNNEAQMDLDS